MKVKVLSLVFIFLSHYCIAQQDTNYVYLDNDWEASTADSAVYVYKYWFADGLWQQKGFIKKSNKLISTGAYADKELKNPVGEFVDYREDGTVEGKFFYVKGKKQRSEFYYENGKLKVRISYDAEGKAVKEEGWDENGAVIPNYIFQRQAMFPGGNEGWRDYLVRKLKYYTPERNGAPAGKYTVTVTFLVDTEGNITEVTAENNPGYGTAEEAVRVIANGPKWIPAIQYNKKVIFRQKQNITFMVDN